MPRAALIFLTSLGVLFAFSTAKAEGCRSVRPFDAAHSKGVQKFEVIIVGPQSPGEAVPTLPKKLLPFVYTTTSSRSYALYTQARQALSARGAWTKADLEKARSALEKAIQADYNNVPAYLALSETLAAEYRLTSEGPLKNRALLELKKAKVLSPPLSGRREAAVRWYLEGKAQDVCGGAS